MASFIDALFARRVVGRFRTKWRSSENRRIHAVNRKGAIIEANRGIYFPRAASKLVPCQFVGRGHPPRRDSDKSAAKELNKGQLFF